MIRTALATALGLAAFVCALPVGAASLYGGVGTPGLELGVSQGLGHNAGFRLELNALTATRSFRTSDIDYDARLKFINAGAYLDGFLVSDLRLTGGALVGSRKVHGTAKTLGSSIVINGIAYPVAAGDGLDFDARFPAVTPYLGIGWGHRREAVGLHFYADAGVAFGRPVVQLSPTASLAAKVSPSDLAAEQSSAQDRADRFRYYPVVKLGVDYAF